MSVNFAISQLGICLILVVVTLVWGIFRYRKGIGYGNVKSRHRWFRFQGYLLWFLGGLIVCSSTVPIAYLYTEHLWFESVGYADVFWKRVFWRWGIFGAFFLFALSFMHLNAAFANRLCPESREFGRWNHTRTVSFQRTVFCITVFLSLIFATTLFFLEDAFFRYLNRPPANVEPILLGKERNFYLFSFPIHKWVSLWVEILLWVTCIIVALLYNFYYRRDARTMVRVKKYMVVHGSILWLLLLGVNLWRSYVNLWGKVYTSPLSSSLSTIHGMFYVDVRLEGATNVYRVILLCLGIVILFNFFWRKRFLWYTVMCVWGASYLGLIHAYPQAVHLWDVKSTGNALIVEKPYLEQHIKDTRAAFDLDTIVEKEYKPGAATLEMIEGDRNKAVRDNVQLWDRRILYDVLRADYLVKHHNFHPYTDVDRYHVSMPPNLTNVALSRDGEKGPSPMTEAKKQYRQVLIAAREIEPDSDSNDRRDSSFEWGHLKLGFTHGYGVYVAPVNVAQGEQPVFWVEAISNQRHSTHPTDKGSAETPQEEDISVKQMDKYPELEVTQPRIYYGEMTHDYVVVNTKEAEYNVVTAVSTDTASDLQQVPAETETGYHYTGTGGVALEGWFRRLCFAIRFASFQILRSDALSTESRVMFWRKIGTRNGQKIVRDRLSHIAPFLDYDADPYIVINNGELWWIIDFYVTSKWYPNAQYYEDDTSLLPANALDAEPLFKRFNYIRNSGVAVVNAYSGAVNFYAVKENEAMIGTYQKAFPNLFKGTDEMPEGLRMHLRFPDYLTRIQAKMYGDYHVTDPTVFLFEGMQWKIPLEVYGPATKSNADKDIKWAINQEMMPYYAMLKLPGQNQTEFVNMIPFRPSTKERKMKAWMVARCDEPYYGERIVYVLSNPDGVDGPRHIEEEINSQLSEKFLNWKTSNTISRGSLHVIPIEGGIFFVEPIYTMAEKSERADRTDGFSSGEAGGRPRLKEVAVVVNEHQVASDSSFDAAMRETIEVGKKVPSESIMPRVPEQEAPNPDELWKEAMKALQAYQEAYKKAAQSNQ